MIQEINQTDRDLESAIEAYNEERFKETSVSNLKEHVEKYEEASDFSNDQAIRALKLHLKALAQFEKTADNEKVVTHLHGFKDLLDYYAQEKQMTDEAYEALTDGADSLIDILG